MKSGIQHCRDSPFLPEALGDTHSSISSYFLKEIWMGSKQKGEVKPEDFPSAFSSTAAHCSQGHLYIG